LRFVHTSLAPLHRSLGRLAKRRFSAAIIQSRPIPFRPHYRDLEGYFSILRSKGQIYYESDRDGRKREYLYLVDAQRFPD
jgi:hypothetical protein